MRTVGVQVALAVVSLLAAWTGTRSAPPGGAALAAAAVRYANDKPSGPLAVSLVPRAEVTAPGAAVADLSIRAPDDLASLQVTLMATGSVVLSGSATLSLGRVAAGTDTTRSVPYRITSPGPGELRATVTGLLANGGPTGAQTAVVYVLNASGEVMHGRSGPLDLQHTRLDRDRAAGRLDDVAYTEAVDALLGGGAAEAASRSRSGKQITVTGRIAWTDRAGNTHPVRLAPVEIRDVQLGVPPLVTTSTDLDGRYAATVMNVGPGGRDILVRVYAQAPGFTIRTPRGTVQRIQSSVHRDVPDGTTLTIDLTANNTLDNNTAFSAHDALVTAVQYVQHVRGARFRDLDVIFPSFFTAYAGPAIHLLRLDRFDWDVILHEYGHHASASLGIENNPGGVHGPFNMGEFLGKGDGILLAWDEGWATYFGTTVQQVMGTRALGIPFVGDTRYTDTEDFDLDYDLETQTGGFESPPSFVILSTGEDNEISVQRILWDLFDAADDAGDSGVAFGDLAVWDTLDAANPFTLSAAYAALTAGRPVRDVARMGCVFSEHRVAPDPTAPDDGRPATPRPTTFTWEANGGGPSNRNDRFTVEFYDASFTTLLFVSAEQAATSFTPTQAQWDSIRERAGGQVNWLVRGRQTNPPATGPYRSCPRRLTVTG